MRVTSTAERDLLASSEAHVHARVYLEDADGVMQPMHAFHGVDWFDSIQWSEGIDAPVISGTLTLRREAWHEGQLLSLSPLMSASPLNRDSGDNFAPMVASFRRLTYWEAVTEPGVTPGDEDFRQVIEAVVDDLSFGGASPVITIEWRDKGAVLLDAQIEEERIYSTDEGEPVQDVMQQILNDNGHSSVTLHVHDPGGELDWHITTYRQGTGSVLAALRALALQIGWEVRYRWLETTAGEEFVLALYKPVRDTLTADTEFGPGEYLAVSDIKMPGADVRNVVRVWYVDGVTGQVTFEEAAHLGSIAQYGRRFMAIRFDASDNINSSEEALAMATAAVEDLHSPLVDQSIDLLPWSPVQLGDVYDFLPSPNLYDETHRWGVVGIRQARQNGSGRTTILTRGQPAGAFRTWLNMAGQGRRTTPGFFPNPEIGPVWGEYASAGEGGDGGIWLRLRFESATKSIRIYSETGPSLPLPMPQMGVMEMNYEVLRLEGETAGAEDWETYVFMATTPGWWRKGVAVPMGYGGEEDVGIPVPFEAQAVNAIEPAALPPVTGFSMQRAADTVTLSWTAGVHDSPADVLYFVRRNGHVIDALEAPESPPEAMQFVDRGLEPGMPYDYQVFAWTDGVTSVAVAPPDPGDPPPPGSDPPPPPPPVPSEPQDDPDVELRPMWTQAPRWELVDGLYELQFAWECADPLATIIEFEHRPHAGVAWMLAGQSSSVASGSASLSGFTSPLWRLVSRDAGFNLRGVSDTVALSAPPGGMDA